MSDFNTKLTMLIMQEADNKPLSGGMTAEKSGEIVEALARQLGTHIALVTGGDAKHMSEFLEGASAYMFEAAAEKQKVALFMADPANRYYVGPDGVARKGGANNVGNP
jgi:hypothetical protein